MESDGVVQGKTLCPRGLSDCVNRRIRAGLSDVSDPSKVRDSEYEELAGHKPKPGFGRPISRRHRD